MASLIQTLDLRRCSFYSIQTIQPLIKTGVKFSTATNLSTPVEHAGYCQLIKSKDWEKVDRICQVELKCSVQAIFPKQEVSVNSTHLQLLLSKVKKVANFPVYRLGELDNDKEAIHFKENWSFINLPYGSKVSGWSDRIAFQKLIRNNFTQIFQPEDLVIVPGCADGQIPIEIAAHNLMYDYQLHIVAADYNISAMHLGYLTMKSYNIDPSRVAWVQANAAKESFFEWIRASYPSKLRYKMVTLVQPSLREDALLSLLKNNSSSSRKHQIPSTVVMPMLLMDKDSGWYKRCNSVVQSGENNEIYPKLIWNEAKYGMELLKFCQIKTENNEEIKVKCFPEQYFVYPECVKDIQEETGHRNASLKLLNLPEEIKEEMGEYQIHQGIAKRTLCLWEPN